MSRTLKKILVFFTLLCIVVVLVFAAELVYLNRDGGEADAKAPPAGSPAGTATPPPTSPETESAPPTDTTPPASESSQEEADSSPEYPPEESQYTLAMTPEVSLTLNADAEEFVYEIKDEGYTFTYKESAATLDVLLDYLPRGAASRAVGFLDNYPGVGESTVENEREIGKSSLVGAYVTAMSGESTYAAWIYEIPSEDDHLGILFVIHYADEAQRGALYKLLDSIELIPTTLDLNADGEIDGLRMPGEPG